jgi:CubicO group peptidase (beta-lactamase class C family)
MIKVATENVASSRASFQGTTFRLTLRCGCRLLRIASILLGVACSIRVAPAAVPVQPGQAAEAPAARPTEQADMGQTVMRIVRPMTAQRAIPELIVGISLHGVRQYFGYSGTGTAPPSRDTIVEIGSITKVFTTALLAEAIQEGRIAANGSIQQYLPTLSLQPCARKVTPVELGTPTLHS